MSPKSTLIPRAEQSMPECAHFDQCGAMEATHGAKAGWITFRLPRMTRGLLIVCCPDGNFRRLEKCRTATV